MALNLSNTIDFKVINGEETVIDTTITVNKLNKKEQKKISTIVKKTKDADDTFETLDELEKASKLRFDLQIEGDGKGAVQGFADEYGYLLVMTEIDELVSEAKEKRS